MPIRQALNAVYARVVSNMDTKERKEFVDSLYGFTELNRAGNDALREPRPDALDDVRRAEQAINGGDA